MKEGIHPQYTECVVTCSCGNTFTTHSTLGTELKLAICGGCHPFFTGTQKLVDTQGRVDRFNKRYGITAAGDPSQTTNIAKNSETKKSVAKKGAAQASSQ